MLIAEAVKTQENSVSQEFGDNVVGEDGIAYLPVERLRRQYIDFLGGKVQEIEEQKLSRHYYHGAQWSAEDIKILRARRQPIVTYNRVGRKINGIVGLMQKLRQDPKAFPRNPGNDEGAEVATSTVRYVCDSNLWEQMASECARQASIDGIGGVELKLRAGDKGDPDIEMCQVFAEDWFYDPRSFKFDFSDGRYHGIAKWLDIEEAIELFPDKEEELRALIESGSDLTTYADREFKWIHVNERRVRLVEHWYKNNGKWHWCFYISSTLLDQGQSPFLNERRESVSRFHMFSACVDHDGDRYGFVRNMKGPQDEINQRRSRGLFISNSKRLFIKKGAVADVEMTRREYARPDGIIEENPGFSQDGIPGVRADDTRGDLEAQLNWYTDAQREIDGFANVTPFAAGETPPNVSGRAVNLLQQGGIAELGPFILSYRDWKIRVYRAIWCMAQQFWNAERWIRVTDDQQLAQFIQLNGLDVDETGRPIIVNALGALDVDIIMDEGPDVINMMADTFDTLSNIAKSGTQIPPQVMIELAPIQSSMKQRLLKMMEPQVDPMKQRAAQLELENMASEIAENRASALQRTAHASLYASKANLNAEEVLQTGLAGNNVAIPPGQQPAPHQMGPAASPPQGAENVAPAGGARLPNALLPVAHSAPPIPGARLARDGRHYIEDPRRPGKYLMVA